MKKIDYTTAGFLVATTLVSVTIVPAYLYFNSYYISIVIFAILFGLATNLSITAGYHRMYSHKAYDASNWVKWVYLLIGAAAFQGSALKWSSDHRRHHANEDTDLDPYSINKGFWYAHIKWLFYKDSSDQPVHAPDLALDRAVMWQHRHYPWVAVAMGFVFPTVIGWLFGSAIQGFLFGGVLRAMLTQHSTFLVNSLAHTWGRRPYSLEITARDNICVAFLTHGEGYHNFHHKFQYDYRNGIRWYHWDPTKWVIQALAVLGQAQRLRSVPMADIQKAKLAIDEQRLKALGVATDQLVVLKQKIEVLHAELKRLHAEYQKLKQRDLKREMRAKQRELKELLYNWKREVQMLHLSAVPA